MHRRRLLCTDLDRTLLPNGSQPETPVAAQLFEALVDRPELTLAFVTGRHRELVVQAMMEYDLPRPHFILGDVGSSIYRVHAVEQGQHSYERDLNWDHRLADQWPEESVHRLRQLITRFPEIEPQESEKQGRFKLSYYLPASLSIDALRTQLTTLLQAEQIAANMIFSVDSEISRGLLDLLPPSANKLKAIEYLMEQFGFEHGDVLFAGDSGNDVDVFASSLQSVIVANAPDELKAQADQACWPACLIARGIVMPEPWTRKWNDALLSQTPTSGPALMSESSRLKSPMALNGNYRSGIVEGMFHYWPETRGWLPKQVGIETKRGK